MTIRFSIDRWAAWSPGLSDQASWRRWLMQPWPLPAEDRPALNEMPAMLRRRVEPLGRAALQAAWWCQAESERGPVVFASRYGDLGLSVHMLEDLAGARELSPTAFSLSVHNAIAGQYSIARGDTSNYSSVAAGADTVPAAVTEASGLLADGAPSVLLVVYEQPLPAIYQGFEHAAQYLHAWACQIVPARPSCFALQIDVPAAAEAGGADLNQAQDLPADLSVLRFLLGDGERLQQGRWLWSRHV